MFSAYYFSFVFHLRDQSYKHHIQRLAQDLSGYEPEVVLAVRLGKGEFVLSDPEDGTEEDSEIDGFLSSNGFEFVDATVATPSPRGKREEGVDSYEDGEHICYGLVSSDHLAL